MKLISRYKKYEAGVLSKRSARRKKLVAYKALTKVKNSSRMEKLKAGAKKLKKNFNQRGFIESIDNPYGAKFPKAKKTLKKIKKRKARKGRVVIIKKYY